MTNLAYKVNLAATLYMTGLIWFVQVVHYPLFARVGAAQFGTYERMHQQYTGYVVVPGMLLELATAVFLAVYARPAHMTATVAWVALGLLVVAWLSTFLLQVPQHQLLADGFNAASHERLVGSNWVRTAAWSGRACLLLWGLP
jgi:uncharacterized membrane protein